MPPHFLSLAFALIRVHIICHFIESGIRSASLHCSKRSRQGSGLWLGCCPRACRAGRGDDRRQQWRCAAAACSGTRAMWLPRKWQQARSGRPPRGGCPTAAQPPACLRAVPALVLAIVDGNEVPVGILAGAPPAGQRVGRDGVAMRMRGVRPCHARRLPCPLGSPPHPATHGAHLSAVQPSPTAANTRFLRLAVALLLGQVQGRAWWRSAPKAASAVEATPVPPPACCTV